ncbi:MAG: hypothetical protein B7Z10_06950 [Rhodobacterales bacterium 32-66-7]|nr:MAG: hypothetical protein B7Z31_02185 [Rhodobacterales bacterium 12-65-15]OYX25246.1 MAG: hypothetical protein B7Z10_06950 [Rhodobacterales bacterium 32-66-7]OZA14434.1 MAG: hypothetical protein B7Y02_04565 [Rhodobacterales bacterium 17-64-5]
MGLNKALMTALKLPLVVLCATLAACASAPVPQGINDPNEAMNRKFHAFNRDLDRSLVRPVAKTYGKVVPGPVRGAVANVADTLDLPGDILNNILQARVEDAANNTLRLAINLTAGIGGLIDVSGAMGLVGAPTDFGETLHVWGVGEGAYVEQPFSGPSTTRDSVGGVVDLVLNPVRLAFSDREAVAATSVQVLSLLGDRDRFSGTVDSVLYDSADSYAQTRLLYLQNRRFELGQVAEPTAENPDDGFIDPYEDPYGE